MFFSKGSDTVCKTCDYPKDGMSQPSGAKKGKGGQHSWETKGTLRVLNHGSFDGKPAHKVASFDMDGTLVNPKSGAKFPKNRADWVWFHDSVPNKLKELSKEGYRIVIFTNQAGVEKNHVKDSDIMGKIVDLAEVVGVPFQALIACANDRFRKPHLTMWDHYVKDLNGGVVPKDAFYCGDAAGRHKGWKDAKTKKDFSCSDRKFAANCKMNFMTPEEVFLGEKPTTKWTWGSMDPKELLQKYEKPGKAVKIEPVKEQELVILMGPPASGKSTIAKAVFEKNGYVRANNDDHGTKAKCLKICKEALANGKSVVIDNTNSNISVRSEYLAAAKVTSVSFFVLKNANAMLMLESWCDQL